MAAASDVIYVALVAMETNTTIKWKYKENSLYMPKIKSIQGRGRTLGN